MKKSLILILGDQLTPDIGALRAADPANDIVLMAEVMAEASYVRHHKKKIALVFSAMRHFADELRGLGWTVEYTQLDDADNSGSLAGEVLRIAAKHSVTDLDFTEPGEWRLREELQGLDAIFTTTMHPDDRFIASHAEFESWAQGRKALRMEYFYRDMRRKTGLLMDGDQPTGGQWNFDHDNRKAASSDLLMPQPMHFAPDDVTQDVLDLVEQRFAGNFGTLAPFWFATTRDEAERAFAHFLKTALPQFGDYQDAMVGGEKFLYHAVIGLYLNCGLLDPLAVCRAVEAEYHAGRAPLNAVEGFIRQIIGWREYVRGIYWREGPDYVHRNALEAKRPLPSFYWDAKTDMACIRACVEQTRDDAYAHHIQRLMVTGNFALLVGVDPYEVHLWYLAVYADAYEWVEAPNVVGMSQFADGGLLASKPYIASGAYIDRMSDYCGKCRYKVKLKAGRDACPFNYLYWDFVARHRDRLSNNPRIGQSVRTYDKFTADRKAEIEDDSQRFLNSLSS
jgi:deoxyribodipyrimidine photolyase-related protein